MSKLNPQIRTDSIRLSGDMGAKAAHQCSEATLRRLVMASLLWENLAYVDGQKASEAIAEVLPKVEPDIVAQIVRDCRFQQKLRHTPLYLIRVMASLPTHKHLVSGLLAEICTRADMVTDFLAIYWKNGKIPLSAQVKKGLAAALENFNEYKLAKYDRNGAIKLRDVLFLTHAKPSQDKQELYKKISNRSLTIPDTWEVALSTGKDRKESWERLINERKLGALAFLRNIRNMTESRVDEEVIRQGFKAIRSEYLLPINFFAAAQTSPQFIREIESMMFDSFKDVPKLSGTTAFVVDVSGSMTSPISDRSTFSRMQVASAMTMLAAEQCENIKIYATSGSDGASKHQTEAIKPYRGFALSEAILEARNRLGGGGIFTRQSLDFIREREHSPIDRIVVFSDSQDCDREKAKPQPFGKTNYIIDVGAHQHGINYQGVWTAEISGWSEHFLKYIALLEQQ